MAFFKRAHARSPGSDTGPKPSKDEELIRRYEAFFGREMKALLRSMLKKGLSVDVIAISWQLTPAQINTWISMYGLDGGVIPTRIPTAKLSPADRPTPAVTHSAILTRLIEREGTFEAAKTFLEGVLSSKRTMGAAAAHCKIAHESVFGKITPLRFAELLDEVGIPRTSRGKGKPGGPGGSSSSGVRLSQVSDSVAPQSMSGAKLSEDTSEQVVYSLLLRKIIKWKGSLNDAKTFISAVMQEQKTQVAAALHLTLVNHEIFGQIDSNRLGKLLDELELPRTRMSATLIDSTSTRRQSSNPKVSPGARGVVKRSPEDTDRSDNMNSEAHVKDIELRIHIPRDSKLALDALCAERGITLRQLLTDEYLQGHATTFPKAYALPISTFIQLVKELNGGVLPERQKTPSDLLDR